MEVVHYLDIEDMLVGLLGAQVHVTLWGEGVVRVHVESQAAESVL